MGKKVNLILKEVLEEVNPSKKEIEKINRAANPFLEKLKKQMKKLKIDADVFVGGSFAKQTAIKKDYYDIDVFVRFEKKYGGDISSILEKILKKFANNFKKIHGSRDYFRIRLDENLYLELVPVIKIKNSKQAENITDLSYLHVNYIKRKIKNAEVLNQIKITKAFCYANKCYGAESYINGFSGYALELLIYYYRSFIKFVREIARIKIKSEKIIIDIEKHYRNKQILIMNMNSSKLQSPIILVDPTFSQRNALAALSQETFEKFQEVCKKFIKNPSKDFFILKKTDLGKLKQNAKKKKNEFVLIKINTDKQEGDVAGSKMFKFYKFLLKEINRFFIIKNSGFDYGNEKSAQCFFVVKSKKEILNAGPSIKQMENVKAFKKIHKKTFVKKGRIYSREKINFALKQFFQKWKNKNKRTMNEMSIKGIEIK